MSTILDRGKSEGEVQAVRRFRTRAADSLVARAHAIQGRAIECDASDFDLYCARAAALLAASAAIRALPLFEDGGADG